MVSVLAGQLPVSVFVLAMIMAGTADVLDRRIPNTLIIGMLLSFLPLAALGGIAGWTLLWHALVGLGLLLLGFGLFSLGFIGGGDAKLMAAVGLWLGPLPLPFFVLSTVLCGGILAAAIGVWYMFRTEIETRSPQANRVLKRVTPDVPYGFAFAAGAILSAPYSWMILAAAGQT